jgi:hypothetical protein
MASTPQTSQPPYHTIAVTLSDRSLVHLHSMLDHGALQGPHGNKSINPNIRDLINGIYQVLAGGTVTVQVTQPGAAGIYNGFIDTENRCMDAVNAINSQYPIPLVLEV